MFLIRPGMTVYVLRDVLYSELLPQMPDNADSRKVVIRQYSPALVAAIDNIQKTAYLEHAQYPGKPFLMNYAELSPGATPSLPGWFDNAQNLLDRLHSLEVENHDGRLTELRKMLADLVNLRPNEPSVLFEGIQVVAVKDIPMAMLQGLPLERDTGEVWIYKGTRGRVIGFDDRRVPVQAKVKWEQTGGDEDGVWNAHTFWIHSFPYAIGDPVEVAEYLELYIDGAWVKMFPGDKGEIVSRSLDLTSPNPFIVRWEKTGTDCEHSVLEINDLKVVRK